MEPDWHATADCWRERTSLWMNAGDAMANALMALLRDGSVVAAATPEDLARARAALAMHPHANRVFWFE